MSLQDRLILSHLKRINHIITESVEEITPESLYKISEDLRIEFKKVMDDVWSFSLNTSEGTEEIGKVYKVADDMFTSRADSIPDIEFTKKTMIDSALELIAYLGKI